MRYIFYYYLTICILAHFVEANIAAMSIDLGSQFIKIGLVKPGVPMEVILNKESRRKTPNILGLRNGERSFGDVAAHLVRYFHDFFTENKVWLIEC